MFVSGNSRLFILGEQRSCDGRGDAQRPVWRVNEPKKTGARSARAHTRGQNPLVVKRQLVCNFNKIVCYLVVEDLPVSLIQRHKILMTLNKVILWLCRHFLEQDDLL